MTEVTLNVYLDDGSVFEYTVSSLDKAREHSDAIVSQGYRHTTIGTMEYYPSHRIKKVKCTGGMTARYLDTVEGT